MLAQEIPIGQREEGGSKSANGSGISRPEPIPGPTGEPNEGQNPLATMTDEPILNPQNLGQEPIPSNKSNLQHWEEQAMLDPSGEHLEWLQRHVYGNPRAMSLYSDLALEAEQITESNYLDEYPDPFRARGPGRMQ